MTKQEAFLLIDVLRSHEAANLYLDRKTLGNEFFAEINFIAMFKMVYYIATCDELADLLYLAVIEEVLK